MKKLPRRLGILTTVGATFALTVSLLTIGAPQANAADYATITGTVTADAGGAALNYPQVRLYQQSGTTWKYYDFTSGGKDGTYQFQNLPTGTYTLSFSPQHGDNFVAEWWNNQPDEADATTISISNTVGSVSHVVADASLATGATISGKITTPTSSFIPDPDISLLVPDTSQGFNGWKYANLWAYPNDDGSGNYTIVGIPPGTYSLFFGDDASGSDLAPLYYSSSSTGTPNVWDASSITLTAGQNVTGADATYVHGATVSGKVTDSAGTAISGATVTFLRQTDLVVKNVKQWESWTATTGKDGTFKTTKLPAGTWGLQYTKSGYTTVDYQSGKTFTLTSGQQKSFSTVKMYKKLTIATPTISGTRKVGSTLTAHPGKWTSGTSFSYQWYASGKAISKATHSTFKLTSAQRGKTITVKVTGKKSGYTTASKTSAATAKIG